MKAKYKLIKNKLIVIAICLVVVILVSLLKQSEFIAEYVFSRGISRLWVTIVSFLTSIIPFSLLEIFAIIFIIVLIIGLVKVFKFSNQKDLIKTLNYVTSLLMCAIVILTIYNLTASANYFRKEVPLRYASANLEAHIILEGAEYFLDDFNQLGARLDRDEEGNVINPYSRAELAEIAREEMKRLEDSYFNSYTPYYKNLLFSDIADIMSIGGVFFSPLGEANVSTSAKACHIPVTIIHELSHAKGIMRENEANLVAYFIALTSDNDYIRYSGYMSVFFASILNSVRVSHSEEEFWDFYSKLDKTIVQEYFRYDEPSWIESKISELSTKMNDFYLKLSGVEDGVASYYQGRAIVLPPKVTQDEIIRVYTLTPTQRLIFNIYLDYSKVI